MDYHMECPGGSVPAEKWNELLKQFREVNAKLKALQPDPVVLSHGELTTILNMLVSRAKAYKGKGISPIIWNVAFGSVHHVISEKAYKTVLQHMNYRPEKYNQIITELIEGPEAAAEIEREKALA